LTAATQVAVVVGRTPADRYSVHRGYVEALWAVGATAVLVPAGPGADVDRSAELVEAADALLITGGGDVDPARYDQEVAGAYELDPDRDAVEVAMLHAARTTGRPVLGICRGIQLIAAGLGGSLVQDLAAAGHLGHWEEERQYEPVHEVVADVGSLAAAALAGAVTVNSIHHQAVVDPGPDLRATAWSPDGVIEAIEGDGVLGVQWHPERLIGADGRHLAPFRWLVSA
jgi:putative glutamine amidotransferase